MAQNPTPPRTPKGSEPKAGGRSGLIVPAIAAAGLLALGGYALWATRPAPGPDGSAAVQAGAPEGCITDGLDAVGGPIDLVDKNGRSVTDADLRGAPSIVYFGYTLCPDVCGPSMYTLGDAVRALGPDFGPVQPVFITVDPDRDTTDIMEAYIETEGFAPGLIGLTGSVETNTMANVVDAQRAFRVAAPRQDLGDGQYIFGHTSFFYILDADWRVRGMISTVGEVDETGAYVTGVTGEQVAQCARFALAQP
jgi:protein SCO1/2